MLEEQCKYDFLQYPPPTNLQPDAGKQYYTQLLLHKESSPTKIEENWYLCKEINSKYEKDEQGCKKETKEMRSKGKLFEGFFGRTQV